MRALTYATVVLIAFAACGKDESATPTQVAVKNDGAASIDATVSDGETDLSFKGVAAGSTSSFQTASFGALTALTVTVGTQSSSVDLGAGVRNVIQIKADNKVGTVAHEAVPSGGGDEGGW